MTMKNIAQHYKRSKYQVGDTIWFVADAASVIYLSEEGDKSVNKYKFGPTKFNPIPVRGHIVAIYKRTSVYEPSTTVVSNSGGSRTNYGYVTYTEYEDVEYEVMCHLQKEIIRRPKFSDSKYLLSKLLGKEVSQSSEEQYNFFLAKLSVEETFAADTPEEAEVKYGEKEMLDISHADIFSRTMRSSYRQFWITEHHRDLFINKSLSKCKVYLAASSILCNHTITGFSHYLETLKSTPPSYNLIEYKYLSVFYNSR